MLLVKTIIQLHGILDIICSASILRFYPIPAFRRAPLSLFTNYEFDNPVLERFFAYWFFTHGFIRLSDNSFFIQASYFLEALAIANECYRHGIIKKSVGSAIVISCILLGLASDSITDKAQLVDPASPHSTV